MKELYRQTFDKINMDVESEQRIFHSVTGRRKQRISFKRIIPAAVAAVCLTGGITAAAVESDFIKELFGFTDTPQISDDLTQMEGVISDIVLTGDNNMTVSPVGMIGDDKNIYCVFDLTSVNDYLDPDSKYSLLEGPDQMLINNEPAINFLYACETQDNLFKADNTQQQIALFAGSQADLSFKNGDRITFPLRIQEISEDNRTDLMPVQTYRLEFTINFDARKTVTKRIGKQIYCSNQTTSCLYQIKHSLYIDTIVISSFGYTVRGTTDTFIPTFYASAINENGEKINTYSPDGLHSGFSGGSTSLNSDNEYDLFLQETFAKPVDTDSIKEIDINGTHIVLDEYPE